ncbi:hypothetical protein QFZ30_003955 [Arthrobacter pascens]|uniref:hypothetical protein n=1 Tax=Arthrobacter pascens TaxID=1677 RepID=UPI00278DBE84|nr:hypothetical protein [Arthrobacter pascens]MDQ0680573.1 hypothetical protein [Arthrobacter pascens]
MENTAAVEVQEAIEASVAAVGVLVRRKGPGGGSGVDLLRQQADDWLEVLAEGARLQAKSAALMVHAAAGFADTTRAMAAPEALPQERTAQEMAIVAEEVEPVKLFV